MEETSQYKIATYSYQQRLLINFLVSAILLLVSQVRSPFSAVGFGLGTIVYLSTISWAIIRLLHSIRLGKGHLNVFKPLSQRKLRIPSLSLPQVVKPSVSIPSWELTPNVLRTIVTLAYRSPYALLAICILMGLFYYLAFIRFLNAHNGIEMFYVWKGLS